MIVIGFKAAIARRNLSRSRRGNEADSWPARANRPPRYLGSYHFSDALRNKEMAGKICGTLLE